MLDAYLNGLKHADLKLLESAFVPDGMFCAMRDPKAAVVCTPFAEVFPRWAQVGDPKAQGKVLASQSAGERMHSFTYQLDFDGKRFIDQFLLYRTETGWRIAAKTSQY